MKKFYFQNGYTSDTEESFPNLFNIREVETIFGKDYYFTNKCDIDCYFGIFTEIYTKFQEKIFPDSVMRDAILYGTPIFLSEGGLSSDVALSRKGFEIALKTYLGFWEENDETTYKILYLRDCEFLIDSLVSQMYNVRNNLVQFYISFSEINPNLEENSILRDLKYCFSTGSQVDYCYNYLYNIFIYLYSSLDIITKILYEYQNLHQNYNSYRQLSSENKLFGNIKHVEFCETEGTIKQNCEFINLVRTLRNEILHNAGWENTPKVFMELHKDGLVEKFIFLPDMNNGNIIKFNNRKRFFSQKIKINDNLHIIVYDLFRRLKKSFENAMGFKFQSLEE